MINFKRFINALIAFTYIGVVMAQTSTNSPYTRYGFGQLSDQSFGHTKAMGGIGYGLRNGRHINVANPASYSAVDSLTFLFDVGMSLQNANFSEGKVKTNAKNSSFDYLAMQFRLCKGLGLTAGLLPYSTVGYKLNSYEELSNDGHGNFVSTSTTYSGDGSLQQIFLGLGYNVFSNLAVGANISYLYGDIHHSVSNTFNHVNAFTSVRTHTISVSSYKLDFGLQYTYNFKKKHAFTLGATYTLGHDMNGDAYHTTATHETTSDGVFVKGESTDTISNAFDMPHSLGLGLTYVYDKRLTLGFDYSFQKWADAKFYNKKDQFSNRTKLSFGAEYLPNPMGRSYLKRIRYRLGAYYSNPYAKIDGKEGAREYGVSAGFGFPIQIMQGKSILNLSGQVVRVEPKVAGMLKETYLRINIGLTFNERWFSKWKVD